MSSPVLRQARRYAVTRTRMRAHSSLVGVCLPNTYLAILAGLVEAGEYQSMSDAIRRAVMVLLREELPLTQK